MQSVKDKQQQAFTALREQFGYQNSMQSPTLQKVVVSAGTGSIKESDKLKVVEDRLRRITGQQPVRTQARQSIASFSVREGDPVGFQITLRGSRMISFLDKLLHIALPRMKDFRGLSTQGIDQMGNYTLGITEHTIFPETSDEELKDVFGLAVTVVTSAGSQAEAEGFLRHLGFPFREAKAAQK